jgi:hypothetical protein
MLVWKAKSAVAGMGGSLARHGGFETGSWNCIVEIRKIVGNRGCPTTIQILKVT